MGVAVVRSDGRLDGWERRLGVLSRAIPYLVLLLSTALYLGVGAAPAAEKAVNLAIAVFAAGWMLWWFTLHPVWRGRTGPMVVFFVGVLVCYAVLSLRDPLFGFFSFAGYVYAVEVLPGRWKFIGVAATAMIAATSLTGGLPAPSAAAVLSYLVIMVIVVTLACTFSFLGHVTKQQNLRRKEMVALLAETNHKLTETMRENAGLHEQLLIQAREAGVQDERQRMAREIHDTLAQGLAGIITQLQAAEHAPDWRRHADAAARLARDSLAEARRSVHAWQPVQLENACLPDALAEVVQRWVTAHGLSVELSTTGTMRPMHPEIEVALLRVAQEALANVAKHASASRVGLTLSYMEDVVTLDVRDDGVGFDAAVPSPGGFGLTGMRQRVSRLAGALAVESEMGGGTAVSATVPAVPVAAGE
jgi:signal transduction histidine kinase